MTDTLALIGLGSNLGDRRAALDQAIARLADTPGLDLKAVSSYHETAPVGGPPNQGPFLNAAAALQVEATLDPFALLDRLLSIEREAGRVRDVRWGPRTIDLDLLLFGDRIIDAPSLKVPHPRMAERRFVLEPLAEIAPEARDPRSGRTVAELLEALEAAEPRR